MNHRTRTVRRYECWPVSGPVGTEYGWRYYIQMEEPRFKFFGRLVWRDLLGPASSRSIIERAFRESLYNVRTCGTQEIIESPKGKLKPH